jgi:glucosamine--fructose-6-phosphate aminotransferase (isomerizing)
MGLDFSLLEGGYLRDLLDEPQVLERTLAGLQESAALSELARDLERGRFQRVVLTGMGASFHALQPLFFALNRRGVTTLMVETSELIHSIPEVLDAATLLVILSQSGRSVEVLRLLELRGATPVIGVTNHADADLAKRADARVLTQAGEEFSVSCKTYVASLLALQWLRGVLCGGERGKTSDELHETAPAAERYLNAWRDHVRELWSEIQDVKHLFLVGRGDSLAAVGTGGLILKESTKFHAEGMSSAAFRHGPFEMTGPGVFVLVFEGEGAAAALNKGLVDDVRKAGGRAALVGSEAELAACRLPAPWTLATPILEILPVQMLSLALAAHANREPGKFHLITKVTTVE